MLFNVARSKRGPAAMGLLTLMVLLLSAVSVVSDQQQCFDDIEGMRNGTYVDASVSKAMLQYSGKSLNDLGSYDPCRKKIENDASVYCLAFSVPASIGLCLPSTCTAEDLADLEVAGVTLGDAFDQIHCGDNNVGEMDNAAIIMTTICVVLVTLVLAGTLIDYRISKRTAVRGEDVDAQLVLEAGVGHNKSDNPAEEPLLMQNAAEEGMSRKSNQGGAEVNNDLEVARPPRQSLGIKAVLCFSVFRNWSTLFTASEARKYKSLDGIRAISLLMVILAHSYDFPLMMGYDNWSEVFPGTAYNTWFQIVLAGMYAVDTFFFLSGFLSAYVTMRRVARGKRVPVIFASVHRYLRLVPAMGFAAAMFGTLLPYASSGPFWFLFVEEGWKCRTQWWGNVLFVNNFAPVHFHDQCMSWTWYLANDMQFFAVGMALLRLLSMARPDRPNPRRLALGLLVALTVVPIAVTAALVAGYDLYGGVTMVSPVIDKSQDMIYTKPYARATAYFAGMLVALMFGRMGPAGVKRLSARTASLTMVLALGATLFVTFFPATDKHATEWSHTVDVLFQSCARPLYALALASVVLLLVGGHSLPAVRGLDNLMSAGIFDPLAKLSYGAYLLHPIVIRFVYFNRTQLWHFSHVQEVSAFLSNTVLSYACSLLMFLLVEQPAAELEKLFLAPK